MANTIVLKRRISSIKGTRQITKAMELVSASKMRRAQEQAKLSRAYREEAYSLLARISSLKEAQSQPLFEKRPVKKKLYVIITSNSGLAGAYNYNVQKKLVFALASDHEKGIKTSIIAIGSKGAQFSRRLSGSDLVAVYPAFGDNPNPSVIKPILNTVLDQYRAKEIDEADIIYTEFKSSLSQIARQLSILPAHDETPKDTKYEFTNFEPSVDEVVDKVAERLIEVQIWQGLLESLASEHSMRMMAMKNASDNANDLIEDYTLKYNTARQAGITQELAEISGGVEALKD
jgi:F-type H+-transporting ATPase subunit gamma